MKAETLLNIFLLILIGCIIMTGIVHERVVASRDKGLATDWNADHTITGDTDMDQYSWQNQVIENVVAFPGGPVEGQIIWRSDLNIYYIFDGTNWVRLNPYTPTNYYYEFHNVDFAINPAVTTLLTSVVLPAGKYLVTGGFNSDIFSESNERCGIWMWLTLDNTEINGSERVVEEDVTAFSEILKSFESSVIVDADGTQRIKLRARTDCDCVETYAHDASLCIVRIE